MRADGDIDWPRGALYGVASAALFGLSAPLSKRLLPDIGPMLLAGVLYLGAGVGLTVVSPIRGQPWPGFKRADWWRLAVIAFVGGCAGPTLLMLGLQRLSGVLDSLLLNLEAVFTMVIAVTWFRDRLAPVEWVGLYANSPRTEETHETICDDRWSALTVVRVSRPGARHASGLSAGTGGAR